MILCVTGTGTDVGKTVATAALAANYRANGYRVEVVKPAQTGTAQGDSDAREITRLTGITRVHTFAGYPEPLAPVPAARRAGMAFLDRGEVVERIRQLDAASPERCVLVEGAGGVLVELGPGWTIADVALDLGAPIVVVTSTGLGSLNHAGLTVEALAHRGVVCAGLIGGSTPADPGLATRSTLEGLRDLGGGQWLGSIPEGAGRLSREGFAAGAGEWLRLPGAQ